MPDYRLYTLDAAGRIMRAPVTFECDSDDEAIQMSQQHRGSVNMELWHRSRLVKEFSGLKDD